jgi:hypothetical protein
MVYPAGAIIHFEGNHNSLFAIAAYHLFYPHTWFYHTALLGNYISDENDYEILESISSGVRIGRLSFYKGFHYKVYWPSATNYSIGSDIVTKASKFGRLRYDFLFFFDMAIEICRIELDNLITYKRFYSIRPWELKTNKHVNFVCTRFTKEAWNLYRMDTPFPDNWAAIPSAYEEAVNEGRLIVLGENVVKHERLRDRIANKIFGHRHSESKWTGGCMPLPNPQG